MSQITVKASIKSIRMSPRKMGVVASLIRGRSVSDALVILAHTPRRTASPLAKLIKSAVANAEHNENAKANTLQIASIEVGHAERGKRFKPAAHGRALPFQLKHSNVKVVLSGETKPKKAVKKVKAETKDVKSKVVSKKPVEKKAKSEKETA